MQLTRFQQFISYLYPIRVRSSSSPVNPVLELFRYQGRWQLGSVDVLYSDGHRYRPLLAAFRAIRDRLPILNRVLVLGTGLGSAVAILHRQGFHPHFTLVELDQVVLDWAQEMMHKTPMPHIRPVCADAQAFVATDQGTYDLIITDVFKGRVVPDFVTGAAFLRQCRQLLAPGGCLVLNYMVNSASDETKAQRALEGVFRQVQELSFGINRVYIATA